MDASASPASAFRDRFLLLAAALLSVVLLLAAFWVYRQCLLRLPASLRMPPTFSVVWICLVPAWLASIRRRWREGMRADAMDVVRIAAMAAIAFQCVDAMLQYGVAAALLGYLIGIACVLAAIVPPVLLVRPALRSAQARAA